MNLSQPVVLDVYCGGGGASMGYYRSGFHVIGIDHIAQPKYPFAFLQMDAIESIYHWGHQVDLIHASPPCQAWTSATKQWRKEGKQYPDLIANTRQALRQMGTPYVIENVLGSPLENPFMLCGTTFNLMTKRHRLFECSFDVGTIPVCDHQYPTVKMGRPPKWGQEYIEPVGHFSGVPYAQQAMEIEWLGQKDLAQAIPPAFTEFIGNRFLERLEK